MFSVIMFSVIMFPEAKGQEIKTGTHAPNFRLFSLNPQQVMQKVGTPDAALLQFVGVNPRAPSYNFIIIMGDKDNLKKEVSLLKRYRYIATQNRIEWALLYTDTTPKMRRHIIGNQPWFPVLDDPYSVVRSRYSYLKKQYCYFVDFQGRFLDRKCDNLSDLQNYLEELRNETN